MKKTIREVLWIMPDNLRAILSKAETQLSDIEEIRLRCGRPLIIKTANGSFAVLENGVVSPAIGGAYQISENDIKRVFSALCENSIYAYSEEIKQGYITIKGGHRAGFSGKAVVSNGKIENIKDINSINIRIASQRIGSAGEYMGKILQNGRVTNTLIVSPPGCGKTTLLRDIARQLSNSGKKVSVIDERGEIGAMHRGTPQNDIGVLTDVIEDAPKDKGIEIMLRSMSPEVIICDEITGEGDIKALFKCFGAGVGVIASAHASSFEDVKERKLLAPILGKIGFNQIILLKRNEESLSKRVTGEIFEVEQ